MIRQIVAFGLMAALFLSNLQASTSTIPASPLLAKPIAQEASAKNPSPPATRPSSPANTPSPPATPLSSQSSLNTSFQIEKPSDDIFNNPDLYAKDETRKTPAQNLEEGHSITYPLPIPEILKAIQNKMISFSEESPQAPAIRRDPKYRDKIINLASFTGGGSKGLMEIYAVALIEDALNNLPLPTKKAIIERRIKRFWDIYSKEGLDPVAIQEIEGKLSRSDLSDSEEPYIYFQDVVDEFAGTSTGSIIAAGLAYMEPIYMENNASKDEISIPCKLAGGSPFICKKDGQKLAGFKRYKAYEIAQIYYRHMVDIFYKITFSLEIASAKYSKENLIELLGSFFGTTTLNIAYPYKNICIPVTREMGEETILSLATTIPDAVSYDTSNFWNDTMLSTIIEASCSAPSFFNPVGIKGGIFCDGGVMLNNPIKHLIRQVNSKFPEKIINAISFGSGTLQQMSDSPNRTARLGSIVGILGDSGKAGGAGVAINAALSNTRLSIMEAYGLLISQPYTHYRLSHLNPILLSKEMKKMDSVDPVFIKNCFSQVNEQLSFVSGSIIQSLLEFLDPLTESSYKFIRIRPGIVHQKISSLDVPLTIDQYNVMSRLLTLSEGALLKENEDRFQRDRLPWVKLHIGRAMKSTEANEIVKSTVLDDPFKRFAKEMSFAERYDLILRSINNLGIELPEPASLSERALDTNRIRRVILARAINAVTNENFRILTPKLKESLKVGSLDQDLFKGVIECFSSYSDLELLIVLCWIKESFSEKCEVPQMVLSKDKRVHNALKGVASSFCSIFTDTAAPEPLVANRQKLAQDIMQDRYLIKISNDFYSRNKVMLSDLPLPLFPSNEDVLIEKLITPPLASRSPTPPIVSPHSQAASPNREDISLSTTLIPLSSGNPLT